MVRTQTILVDTHRRHIQQQMRNLPAGELGGVIFGRTNQTFRECVTKSLFGLPESHFVYVEQVVPGMPLFLYNYNTKELHGIFEATSCGTMDIDPHAWTGGGQHSFTKFPAQVSVRRKEMRPALHISEFQKAVEANIFDRERRLFMHELDHEQAKNFIALFRGKLANQHATSNGPVNRPTNQPRVQGTHGPMGPPSFGPVPSASQDAHAPSARHARTSVPSVLPNQRAPPVADPAAASQPPAKSFNSASPSSGRDAAAIDPRVSAAIIRSDSPGAKAQQLRKSPIPAWGAKLPAASRAEADELAERSLEPAAGGERVLNLEGPEAAGDLRSEERLPAWEVGEREEAEKSGDAVSMAKGLAAADIGSGAGAAAAAAAAEGKAEMRTEELREASASQMGASVEGINRVLRSQPPVTSAHPAPAAASPPMPPPPLAPAVSTAAAAFPPPPPPPAAAANPLPPVAAPAAPAAPAPPAVPVPVPLAASSMPPPTTGAAATSSLPAAGSNSHPSVTSSSHTQPPLPYHLQPIPFQMYPRPIPYHYSLSPHVPPFSPSHPPSSSPHYILPPHLSHPALHSQPPPQPASRTTFTPSAVALSSLSTNGNMPLGAPSESISSSSSSSGGSSSSSSSSSGGGSSSSSSSSSSSGGGSGSSSSSSGGGSGGSSNGSGIKAVFLENAIKEEQEALERIRTETCGAVQSVSRELADASHLYLQSMARCIEQMRYQTLASFLKNEQLGPQEAPSTSNGTSEPSLGGANVPSLQLENEALRKMNESLQKRLEEMERREQDLEKRLQKMEKHRTRNVL